MQFFVACLLSLVYFCKLFLPIRMSDSEMLFQYWKIACLSMTRAISNSWELQIESIRAMTLSAPSSVISCAMRISTALAMTYSAVAENISRGGDTGCSLHIVSAVHHINIFCIVHIITVFRIQRGVH